MEECSKTCHLPKYKLMEVWLSLNKQLWTNNGNVINPNDFLEVFIEIIKEKKLCFDNFEQNDTEEFLTLLFDMLHESISRKSTMNIKGKPNTTLDKIAIKSMKSWIDFFENNYSYIIEKSYSQLLSVTSCPKCNYSTLSHDPIMILQLEMKTHCKTIEDCLNEFTKINILDDTNLWKCDRCKEMVNSEKKITLWNTSDILIIQLKRYNNFSKNNAYIKYQEYLDILPYSKDYNEKGSLYKLISISIHSGSLGGGHYYAVCKNEIDNKWYNYNDTGVSESPNPFNENPYCLFYKRITN